MLLTFEPPFTFPTKWPLVSRKVPMFLIKFTFKLSKPIDSIKQKLQKIDKIIYTFFFFLVLLSVALYDLFMLNVSDNSVPFQL